jgi:hypothetical protein
MAKGSISLEMVNCVLLVVILILVIVCCMKQTNEEFENNSESNIPYRPFDNYSNITNSSGYGTHTHNRHGCPTKLHLKNILHNYYDSDHSCNNKNGERMNNTDICTNLLTDDRLKVSGNSQLIKKCRKKCEKGFDAKIDRPENPTRPSAWCIPSPI